MIEAHDDLSAWPALVLTAGLGTRLRPLSLVRAKAALPVAGDVLVRRVLRWLHAAGVRRVVLNLHHRPETITPHVGDGSDLGLEVRYSWESPLLGSAGGPRRALPLLDADRFLIVNGDTLTNVSVSELTDRHVATGARVTMTVTTGDTRYGGVLVDTGDIVRGFLSPESPEAAQASASARAVSVASYGETSPKRPVGREGGPYSRFHFVGIQAVERSAFDRAPDDAPSESVRWLYPQLIAESSGAVRAYRTSAVFHDIGTSAGYLDTVHRIAGDVSTTQVGRDPCIDPTARITGSILWDRVTIGAHAQVVDCIVADDVTIPAGARYHRQVIVTIDGQAIASGLSA